MAADERMLAVIEAIYDAAMDESRWRLALEKLAEYTRSQAATFWVLDSADQPRLPVFDYINLDPAFIDEYLARMVPQDPTVQYLLEHPDRPLVHDGLVISEREKERHPYYDWHGRHSDTRFRLVGQMSPAPTVQAGVALHRTRGPGRFEADDIERFSVLHGHIERALTIGFRLGTLGTMQQFTLEMMDRHPAAMILLDAQHRVIYTNRRADTLRARGDGIGVTARGLELARKRDQVRLDALIARSSHESAALHGGRGGVMQASRPSGKRPYSLLVTPIARHHRTLSTLQPVVSIAITDPEEGATLPADRLQACFGLTPAEARLAALLAAGHSLRSAAQSLDIRYSTARARLSEIFRKTDTHRQGELVNLLLTTLAVG